MKKDSKKDSGVSPVIGTILLVAITVVLVAIISAVVMGMTGNVEQTYTVGVKVTNDESVTTVLFTGGPDFDKIVDGTIKINDESLTKTLTPQTINPKITGEAAIVAKFPTGEQVIWTGTLK